jgi:hypothetical protein
MEFLHGMGGIILRKELIIKAQKFYRQLIKSGNIYACSPAIAAMWNYDQPQYIDVYEKRIGIAKACLENWTVISKSPEKFFNLSVDEKTKLTSTFEAIVKEQEDKKKSFLEEIKLHSYYLRASCHYAGFIVSPEVCLMDERNSDMVSSINISSDNKNFVFNLFNKQNEAFQYVSGGVLYITLSNNYKIQMAPGKDSPYRGIDYYLYGEIIDAKTGEILKTKSSSSTRENIKF